MIFWGRGGGYDPTKGYLIEAGFDAQLDSNLCRQMLDSSSWVFVETNTLAYYFKV